MSVYELKPSTQWGKNLIPTLNNIFNKLSDKIDDVNTNIIDIKNDLILKLETAQNTANTALKIAEESKAISLDLKEEMNKIVNYCETLKTENINLKQNVNQLDNYSRRNNLVIGGIEEKDNEQCENLVRTFFKDKLKLDSNSVNHMRIVGCHRLGKQFGHRGRPRSIIVRFLDYNDRHIVWMAKKNINDKTLSINEHFCGDTEFKRRKLYPIYRAAKKKEKYRAKVSLIGDTLVLNNQRFYVETIGDLPDDLHPRTMCERSNKDTLVFGGMYSEFSTYSNWSKSAFTFKEKEFICIEQGYMYNKAVINGAPVAAQQISCITDPREIKRLGSAITVSDREQWDAIKGNLMLELVRAKYTQNEALRRELVATGNRTLGETGKDTFYSIGIPLTHPDVLNCRKWKAGNKLGKALETVRADLA